LLAFAAKSSAAKLAIAALSFHVFEKSFLNSKKWFEYGLKAGTPAPASRIASREPEIVFSCRKA
jgi:hypothetical protein